MNSSISDSFISSNEILEFENKIMVWLSEFFKPKKEGFSSQSDSNIPKETNSEYLSELKLIFEESLDLSREKYSGNVAKFLFDKIVKILIENFKPFTIDQKTDLQEITSVFINTLETLKNDKSDYYGNIIPLHQFLPETFNYISNQIGHGIVPSNWVVPNFWKDYIFSNIIDIPSTQQLKFAIKSMVLFINLLKNKEKRLEELKS